jgi:hypothetical protein
MSASTAQVRRLRGGRIPPGGVVARSPAANSFSALPAGRADPARHGAPERSTHQIAGILLMPS